MTLMFDRSETDEHTHIAKVTVQGFQYYLQQQWIRPLNVIENVKNDISSNKVLTAVIINRCKNYKKDSPGKDWQGIYEFKTK